MGPFIDGDFDEEKIYLVSAALVAEFTLDHDWNLLWNVTGLIKATSVDEVRKKVRQLTAKRTFEYSKCIGLREVECSVSPLQSAYFKKAVFDDAELFDGSDLDFSQLKVSDFHGIEAFD